MGEREINYKEIKITNGPFNLLVKSKYTAALKQTRFL